MTIDVQDIAEASRAAEAEAAELRAAAQREAEAAVKARDKADARIAAAQQAEAAARLAAGSELMARMRALTREVRDAFAAAETAIEAGGDVLGLWITAQLRRADHRGLYDALGAEYTRLTGRDSPGGEWGHGTLDGRRTAVLSGGVTRDASVRGIPETFDQWLTRTLARITARRRTEAKARAREALAAARSA